MGIKKGQKIKADGEYLVNQSVVGLDDETHEAMEKVVTSLGVSRSTFIRQAIKEAIADAGVI